MGIVLTKAAALHGFFESFGVPAYEENTVPDDAAFPYVTYEAASDAYGADVMLSASLWWRSPSWALVNDKAEEIGRRIGLGGVLLPCEGGRLWIKRGSPFAQNMGDDRNDMIRRKVLTLEVSFLTTK